MRLAVLLLFAAGLPAAAQIELRINDAAPVTVSADEIAKLPHHNAVLNDHGKQVSYEGVLLRDLLTQHGFAFTDGLHGKQLSSYVAALASDGYEVVFSLTDLDPTISDTDIVIADKRGGQPLAGNEAPLRLIVPGEKRPARSLRMLREIDVVQLRK